MKAGASRTPALPPGSITESPRYRREIQNRSTAISSSKATSPRYEGKPILQLRHIHVAVHNGALGGGAGLCPAAGCVDAQPVLVGDAGGDVYHPVAEGGDFAASPL